MTDSARIELETKPARTDPAPPSRPRADVVARKLLLIHDERNRVTSTQAERTFSLAILLSASRCLLTYIVIPFILPAVGVASGSHPLVGLPVGVLAIVFDVFGIRRFWKAEHKYRWVMSAIYLTVMAMVSYLVIGDIGQLV